MTTGMETEEAVPGSVVAWSNCREQQVGRFRVAAAGDLLSIFAAAESGAGKGKGKADGVGTAEGAPVAFFTAPSLINALVCTGADIVLGCESGAVLQLRAEVLRT